MLDELRFHLGLAEQLPEERELELVAPAWLARWSLTQGWIGQAREELSLHPWLNFYVQDGHGYSAKPGGNGVSLAGAEADRRRWDEAAVTARVTR